MGKVLFSVFCTDLQSARLAVRNKEAIGEILECPKCGSMVNAPPLRKGGSPQEEPSPSLPKDSAKEKPPTLAKNGNSSIRRGAACRTGSCSGEWRGQVGSGNAARPAPPEWQRENCRRPTARAPRCPPGCTTARKWCSEAAGCTRGTCCRPRRHGLRSFTPFQLPEVVAGRRRSSRCWLHCSGDAWPCRRAPPRRRLADLPAVSNWTIPSQ